jgi:hypothetical protein
MGLINRTTKFIGAITALILAILALDSAVGKLKDRSSVLFDFARLGFRQSRPYSEPISIRGGIPASPNRAAAWITATMEPKYIDSGWIFSNDGIEIGNPVGITTARVPSYQKPSCIVQGKPIAAGQIVIIKVLITPRRGDIWNGCNIPIKSIKIENTIPWTMIKKDTGTHLNATV